MEIWKIKDRSMRMIMDRLYCKTVMLNQLKGFTQFDWSKEILRLTREIGEIKSGFTPYEFNIWERVWRRKTGK